MVTPGTHAGSAAGLHEVPAEHHRNLQLTCIGHLAIGQSQTGAEEKIGWIALGNGVHLPVVQPEPDAMGLGTLDFGVGLGGGRAGSDEQLTRFQRD